MINLQIFAFFALLASPIVLLVVVELVDYFQTRTITYRPWTGRGTVPVRSLNLADLQSAIGAFSRDLQSSLPGCPTVPRLSRRLVVLRKLERKLERKLAS